MAIQDSDAERRNLMMTSLGIILYYVAGGEFVDNQVHIQVVNLSFSKPHILAITVWIMLFWFLLRYWQTHKNKAGTTISHDIGSILNTDLKPQLTKYMENKNSMIYEGEGTDTKNFVFDAIEIKLFKWVVNYQIVKNFSKKSDTSSSYLPVSNEVFYLTRPVGLGLVVIATLVACIKNQGFTAYIVPYVLFLSAVIMPFALQS